MIMIDLVVMLMMALTVTTQEGRVLIAGGSDGFQIRRETYFFQLAAIGSWQRGPDLRHPRFLVFFKKMLKLKMKIFGGV